MNEHKAYWNTSKLCWEISVEQPAGDRYEKVIKHAAISSQMLRDLGVRYIDAYINQHQSLSLIMIVDPEWYIDNEKEIFSWAEQSGINLNKNGMILEFKSPEDKMMFMLRW